MLELLRGNCQATNVIYEVKLSTADNAQNKQYIGMTATEFKQFLDARYENDTELSKHMYLELKKMDV